ncbi:TonB-dependent receptor [Acidobacteria bacterium AH-259-A15]|nr:TonB-dependent receptor [Acidobacteria bacterium AH-259-A15]
MFLADDWKVSPSFTLNLGVRYEFYGHAWEVNGILNNFDFERALATGDIFQGLTFASNFNEADFPAFAGLTPNKADTKSTLQPDRNNFAPRFGFAYSPREQLVIRGGYGIFYERTTGAFANSLRQAMPFFRESQVNKVGDWNAIPGDTPAIPIPDFVVGFDDGEPMVATAADPTTEYETFESQVIPPNIATPYTQQWSLYIQWEFAPDYLFEIGYVGSKGTKLLQIANVDQALDVDALGGFLPRPGVPGGGFTTNFYDNSNDTFVQAATPSSCLSTPINTATDDPGDCVIDAEPRMPLLGFDEDEGINTATSSANSIYNSLQVSLEKRFSRGHMFNANYTFSKSIDTFSDEGKFQIENDQTRPHLNRGLSDFDRRNRFVVSWVWELPFRGNGWVEGWAFNGIGTLQSGRPINIEDDKDFSGILAEPRDPRPNLAVGATHADLLTSGSVSSRVDGYLNPDGFEHAGLGFGNLGRNVVRGPHQRRLDLVISKLTNMTEQTSLEFRVEFFNALNNPSFRNPVRKFSSGSFGEIQRTRGGPRVIQVGLRLRF